MEAISPLTFFNAMTKSISFNQIKVIHFLRILQPLLMLLPVANMLPSARTLCDTTSEHCIS